MVFLVNVKFFLHLVDLHLDLFLLLRLSLKPLLMLLFFQGLESEWVISKWIIDVSEIGLVRDTFQASIIAPVLLLQLCHFLTLLIIHHVGDISRTTSLVSRSYRYLCQSLVNVFTQLKRSEVFHPRSIWHLDSRSPVHISLGLWQDMQGTLTWSHWNGTTVMPDWAEETKLRFRLLACLDV